MRLKFTWNLELNKTGLDMFFKLYQQKALEILWDYPEGLNTRQVWEMTNQEDIGLSRRVWKGWYS